ncbi:hypothetical protein RYH80_06360 [Halobaculum sp. MBLA0147]|uniref:hypothetical protein n=1 Tax=Halobaculum sp. MBLA0147 TaxID=3079934 RepID=UPI003524D05E
MTGYHDYVLGLVPALLIGPLAAVPLVGLSVEVAVAVGGAAAALVVGHAMFVRGPVPTVADAATTVTAATDVRADGVTVAGPDGEAIAPARTETDETTAAGVTATETTDATATPDSAPAPVAGGGAAVSTPTAPSDGPAGAD